MNGFGVALRMEQVSKRYPGTLAVDRVDFEVRAGEVHALMGENGAGKSTLMKILAGAFDDYTGRICISGQPVELRSPAQAREYGIGMVCQELSLARPLSISENLLIGRLPVRRGGFVDRQAMNEEARSGLGQVGLEYLDPATRIEEISQHEAQLVEIAKVLNQKPCILVMDEPTSALSCEDVRRLFDIIRMLRRRGMAIVYISHHLPEVFEVADRVTVMRDGRKVATAEISGINPHSLAQMMVGQTIDEFYHQRQSTPGDTMLKVEHLTRYGFVHDVSFNLRRGEILGVAGLAGSGRSELARSLCGLDPAHGGRVTLDGEFLPLGDYPRAVARGLVYLTEDRKTDGVFLRLPVDQNLLSAMTALHSRFGFYRKRNDRSIVEEQMVRLQVAAPSRHTELSNLSGGNQQKVLLGKWLARRPRVLALDEPTRGVDIRAKQRIHEAVISLADEGTSVLLLSSDLQELVGLSDRAIVLRNGRLIGELSKPEMTEGSVLLAMNGENAEVH
ncbi:MAG: sugar ABC transporter ATP-binding protein [Candidatus Sumerlaeota bacterium]|nr:sugar ABC transporter ATP-binding protein [Candidatus Sumerlaeota bacterium]